MNESDDMLRATGLLTLGSRFRRLGERLQGETQEILSQYDPQVPSALHPVLNMLIQRGPQTIGQISAGLGLAQPGVTRSVSALVRLGLVAVVTSPNDGRLRLAELTPEGRDFVALAQAEIWPRVERAVTDLCAGFGPELLQSLQDIEDGLDLLSLIDRSEGPKA